MKLTSAGANKMIKAWNEDLEGLLKKEEAESRTTYGINEEPLPANYDFARMQQQMDALNQKIAVLRHAVNVFNTTTMLEGFGFTIDEALVRMAMLTKKKQRLAQMKQVPLLVRTSPGYGSNTPEMTCRNYDAEQVEQEAVSDVVYESILGHYCIKKQERKTGLDVWVSFLGFFFDLNFAESLRIALKQGYYKKRFLDLNFEDPATEERVRRCIAETEQYAYARLRMEELQ